MLQPAGGEGNEVFLTAWRGLVTQQNLQVDIATRFLGADENVYIVRPGEGFSLYEDFVRQSAVFLDFPDLRLQFDGARPNRDALRQAVVRSMEIQQWHRGKRVRPEPSREPIDYVDATKGRRVGRYVGAIQRLYYELPVGSIVVVPGPGYFSEVRIGQIVGPPALISGVTGYPDEEFPARRVRWMGSRPKARFSEKLRDRLQKPTPVMVIDRSLRHEILEAAFDQYSIGDDFSARLRTTKADFSTLDDFNIQSFLNYVSGVLAAAEEGHVDGKIDMDKAVKILSENRDLVPELTANINSPGALRLFSKKILPIAAMALLAIALQAAGPAGGLPHSVEVINSAVAGDDPCALVIQAQVKTAIEMMDLDTWHRVCVQVRDAAQSTGLATSIEVIPAPEGP